jgi:chemotaxis protein CheX
MLHELEDFRDDVESLLGDVLASVFEEEAEVPAGPAASPDGESPDGESPDDEGPDAAALVAIHDDETGDELGVHVRVAAVLARILATRMFGCDEPTSEDLLDAVGELGNIAGGNVKALLFGAGRLSLPSAVLGSPAGAPPVRDGADAPAPPMTIRALVLGLPVELTLVPDVDAAALVWPPTLRPEVLEGQS